MVPCSTTHFSAPLFFQPVKSFPLNSDTHASCGGASAAAPNPSSNKTGAIPLVAIPPFPPGKASHYSVAKKVTTHLAPDKPVTCHAPTPATPPPEPSRH